MKHNPRGTESNPALQLHEHNRRLAKALEECIGHIEGAYSSSLEDNEPAWLKRARAVLRETNTTSRASSGTTRIWRGGHE